MWTNEERRLVIRQETKKLLSVGYIREIQYLEWLANVVLVKKANGKWRMCVDFMDLNKACPKDSYPLPNIDALVDNVRIYGFKLEGGGGEFFKKSFRNLLSLEWKYFTNTDGNHPATYIHIMMMKKKHWIWGQILFKREGMMEEAQAHDRKSPSPSPNTSSSFTSSPTNRIYGPTKHHWMSSFCN